MFGKRKQQTSKQQRQEPAATPRGAEPGAEPDRGAEPLVGQPGAPQAGSTPSGGSFGGGPTAASAGKTPPSSAPSKPDPNAIPGGRAASASRAEAARRGTTARPTPRQAQSESTAAGATSRQLIVGRDIDLSGEIHACDKLLVEGTMQAELADGQVLEVSETGLFKGTAVVDTAEIAGRFEGDLTVRDRLYLRATGQVTGTIRYKALEIESGGRIGGTMIELTDEDIARQRQGERFAEAAGATAATAQTTATTPAAAADSAPNGTAAPVDVTSGLTGFDRFAPNGTNG